MSMTSLVIALFICVPNGRPDLVGTISRSDGAPVPGATIYVCTASVREGVSPLCPSCYPDCGKSSTADVAGRFTVASLDPSLVFQVVVAAPGFQPAVLSCVDPATGPLRVELTRQEPLPEDAQRVIKGLIVDPDGEPVAGAFVEPFGHALGTTRSYGRTTGADELAVTDRDGRFVFATTEPVDSLGIDVKARGFANRRLFAPTSTQTEVRLARGCTVVGRLVKDGVALPGIRVGLVQQNRAAESFAGAYEISTDGEGRFAFNNVVANTPVYFFGHMQSLAPHGATQVKAVVTLGDDATVDVGDVAVGRAHHLSGRVVLADGKSVPAGTHIMISPEDAWDWLTDELDADGAFAVSGLPAGVVDVSVHIPGYVLSNKNRSLNPMGLRDLVGLVNRDIEGLTILLEPGDYPRSFTVTGKATIDRYEELTKTPIAGVSEADATASP